MGMRGKASQRESLRGSSPSASSGQTFAPAEGRLRSGWATVFCMTLESRAGTHTGADSSSKTKKRPWAAEVITAEDIETSEISGSAGARPEAFSLFVRLAVLCAEGGSLSRSTCAYLIRSPKCTRGIQPQFG